MKLIQKQKSTLAIALCALLTSVWAEPTPDKEVPSSPISEAELEIIGKHRSHYQHDAEGVMVPMTGPTTAEEYAAARAKLNNQSSSPAISEPVNFDLNYAVDEVKYRYYAPAAKLSIGAKKLEGVAGFNHMVGTHGAIQSGMQVAIARSEKEKPYDLMFFDKDRDGKFDDETAVDFKVEERRGKWWSLLYDKTLKVTHKLNDDTEVEGYTDLGYWVVCEGDAIPDVIRYTNKTCSAGYVTLEGVEYEVVLQDFNHDGQLNKVSQDAWYLKSKNKELRVSEFGRIGGYFYGVKGNAWKVEVIDSSGLKAKIYKVKPNMTKRDVFIASSRIKIDNPDERAAIAKEPIVFETDLAVALKKAKERNTNCFVKFGATWCGPCHKLDKLVFNKQEIADAAKGLVCLKIDADKQPEIVKKYSVSAYPTMIMIDGDGKKLSKFGGTRNIKGINQYMKSHQ